MYDVSQLTPMLSEQWWAEMIWWSKFFICYPILSVNIAPVPMSKLKHHHSKLNVIELFPDKDPEAVSKFLDMAENKDHESDLIILRNVFSVSKGNILEKLRSADAWRKYADMSQMYEYALWHPNQQKQSMHTNMSVFFEDFESNKHRKTMQFDFTLLKTQKIVLDEYKRLWKDLDQRLYDRIIGTLQTSRAKSHSFLWYGSDNRTPLHAAPVADYFLQLANSKKWKFIHKHYIPYIYSRLPDMAPGILSTPVYWVDGYEGGIPYTELDLHPGDLMYFPTWHYHEVQNLDPNALGFAIGIRPPGTNVQMGETFKPLAWYGIGVIPRFLLFHAANFGTGSFKGKQPCNGPVTMAWNGTKFNRYNYHTVDGECKFSERHPDYQKNELSGVWKTSDYRPITS